MGRARHCTYSHIGRTDQKDGGSVIRCLGRAIRALIREIRVKISAHDSWQDSCYFVAAPRLEPA